MKPIRILIADHQPVVREGLQSRLTNHKPAWEVSALVATGLEAVAQAVTLTPDIVVMGYHLPYVNGLEAAVQIRQRASRVEVLLFSGPGHPSSAQDLPLRGVRLLS
jgi:DNA-binding NarL/FixJ family response regulator